MNPVLHERGADGKWHTYDYRDNTWGPTNRKYNSINSGHGDIRVTDTRGEPMEYGGGGRKPRHSSHKRSRRNSKKSKRVRHTRRKQTRRYRHRR